MGTARIEQQRGQDPGRAQRHASVRGRLRYHKRYRFAVERQRRPTRTGPFASKPAAPLVSPLIGRTAPTMRLPASGARKGSRGTIGVWRGERRVGATWLGGGVAWRTGCRRRPSGPGRENGTAVTPLRRAACRNRRQARAFIGRARGRPVDAKVVDGVGFGRRLSSSLGRPRRRADTRTLRTSARFVTAMGMEIVPLATSSEVSSVSLISQPCVHAGAVDRHG